MITSPLNQLFFIVSRKRDRPARKGQRRAYCISNGAVCLHYFHINKRLIDSVHTRERESVSPYSTAVFVRSSGSVKATPKLFNSGVRCELSPYLRLKYTYDPPGLADCRTFDPRGTRTSLPSDKIGLPLTLRPMSEPPRHS